MSEQPKLEVVSPAADRPRARHPQPPVTGAPLAGADEVHLLDYVRVLYKRRWTAGTAFLLVLLTVTIYTFTTTPIYESRTRLLIESDDPSVVTFKEVIDEGQAKADYYQTQYNILGSRALARRTIDGMKQWQSPHWSGDVAASGGSWFSRLFGGEEESEATRRENETKAQSHVIDSFLENLNVSPIRNSRLVDVKFRSSDPALAQLVANNLARNYIEQDLEYKFSASKEATGWLQERLAEQRKEVETAELALQRYREQNDAISPADRQNIVVQKLTDLSTAVTRAKTERLQKEAVYRQIAAMEKQTAALDTFPAILSNQFIQQQKSELASLQRQEAQLAEKLGERHPDMIKLQSTIQSTQLKLQGEIAKVVQAVRSEYQAAYAQEQSLTAALEQQKGEAQQMNRKAIDYTVLERDVQSSRQVYDSLLQRAKETGVTGELKASNIRVVDQAELPRSAVKPRAMLNFVLGIFGGLVFAVGLTFFFEYLDSRIKSPDEIRSYLRLPPIGLVPALGRQWSGAEPLINAGVPPNFAESFRALRTNVLFSSAEEGSRTLVVTSTGPGEGKTLVASNMAVAFATAGQRVLLIDADMRRPRVHQAFSQHQEPGLSNVLVGNAKASEAIRKCTVPGLWILSAGRIPPNPAELVASKRFKDFVKSLGGHFDCVVIDSPPVMAVTDAVIVSNVATGVVFVVGAEMTSRHDAKTAIDQLTAGGAQFVGAVLNRVDLEGHSYYYSRYYRREYATYYQAATGTGS